MTTRKAAVAGYFYTANPEELRDNVDRLVAGAPSMGRRDIQGLIVPHAGYVYSGATAGRAYRALADSGQAVRRVLLIGPAHRVQVSAMAIPTAEAFETPLGLIPLDREALLQIETLDGVVRDDLAHRDEHSIEVQLPFLQATLGDFRLVPVVVGGASAAQVAGVIDALAAAGDCLVVVSSDLSHFLRYEDARRTDDETCRRILEGASDLVGEQACGARGINGLMASTLARPLDIRLLQACNSGDTAGSKERVVGYAAFCLH